MTFDIPALRAEWLALETMADMCEFAGKYFRAALDEIERLASERDRLAAELCDIDEALHAAIEGLPTSICSWCARPSENKPEILRAHLDVCEKHPLRAEVNRLRAELAAARERINDTEGLCVFYGGEKASADLDDMRAGYAAKAVGGNGEAVAVPAERARDARPGDGCGECGRGIVMNNGDCSNPECHAGEGGTT